MIIKRYGVHADGMLHAEETMWAPAPDERGVPLRDLLARLPDEVTVRDADLDSRWQQTGTVGYLLPPAAEWGDDPNILALPINEGWTVITRERYDHLMTVALDQIAEREVERDRERVAAEADRLRRDEEIAAKMGLSAEELRHILRGV